MTTREFDGKICFIVGGASGIGLATAHALAERGAIVAIGDVREEDSLPSLLVDVTRPEEIRDAVAGILELHGRLDVAVNCAGVGGARARTAEYPHEVWNQVMAVNLTGVFSCMQEQLKAMVPNRSGVIVNVASVAGITAFPNYGAYTASKHGVVGLTKAAAIEYATLGIRINAICPAYTRTPMMETMLTQREGLEERLLGRIPIGRFATAGEIAESIVYLCSSASGFMTGQCLVLDGGITAE